MSPSPFVSHLVSARARAGYSAQLGARLSTLISPAGRTAGCLHFALQKSMTDDDLWLISGLWANDQAMNAWFDSSDLTIFSELIEQRIVSSFDFQTFKSVSASEAESANRLPLERKAG